MKKIVLGMCTLFAVSALPAQNRLDPEPPFIEVTGSADIEIEPDEIRLSVTISGYKDPTNDTAFSLKDTESVLMKLLAQSGVEKKDVILKNVSTQGYWYYERKDGREEESRMTQEYEIRCTDYSRLSQILAALPSPKQGFIHVYISDRKNSKISEYRKQTKIEAIKAAQEKARYLLESVGSTPGKLLQVIELDEDNGGYRPYGSSNTISQTSLNAHSGGGDASNPSLQPLKLRYRIKARFEIQTPHSF